MSQQNEIPPEPKITYQLDDLLKLMRILRDPDTGCPWDVKQSYRSIAPCTIEEAYEVVDAIEKADFAHLEEELGDLLFQVVFYSQLGKEDKFFDFHSVVNKLVNKLIRRHPHVFPTGNLHADLALEQSDISENAIKDNWENTKQQERQRQGKTAILDDIPVGLSALSRAQKLQKRAAKVGFDWDDTRLVFDKLREEIDELEVEFEKNRQSDETHAELGDVFFSLVNMARHLNLDSETVVRRANDKFYRRFTYIERNSKKPLAQSTPAELEALWEQGKSQET